jgi:hypothetical protein
MFQESHGVLTKTTVNLTDCCIPKKEKMLTPFEMREFLAYSRNNFPEVYENLVVSGSSRALGAERLDAEISWDGNRFCMSYHFRSDSGNVIRKTEKLDETTLIKSKLFGSVSFGVSIEDYLGEGSTFQGFPHRGIKKGGLNYTPPKKRKNGSVGVFSTANL